MDRGDSKILAVRRPRGCLTKILVAVLVAVCALAVLATWMVQRINRRGEEFHREALAAARDHFAARREAADEDNAARPFADAAKLYVKPADAGLLDPEKDAGRDFNSEAVAAYLRDNAACLAALEKALRLPACDYGRDPEKGLGGERIGPLSDVRNAGRLLAVDAHHAAAGGQTGRALGRLLLMLRLADPICAQPVLISRMMRCSVEGDFARALEALLGSADPPGSDLEKLLLALRLYTGRRGNYAAAMEGERFLARVTLGTVAKGDVAFNEVFMGGGARELARTFRWRFGGDIYRDADLLDEIYVAAAEALRKPYPEALEACAAVDRRIDEAPEWALATRMAVPQVGRSSAVDAEALALLRGAELLIGCRLHRLAAGKYPAELGDLTRTVGSMPVDPFSGRDFRYAGTAAGCRLWSVGANRRDDGGDRKGGPDGRPLDVGLELAR